MKHNKELSITIGGSRKETNWKPQRIMWQEFVERLRTPVESEETQEEYKRLTKAQQDDLKDVGGFVGGLLNGSRRKSGSVKSRCLITLDMDNIPAGGTEDVLKRVNGLECAFVVYSTRKHEGAAPRLRVILPTDRELVPDEYEPIARKIASLIGIDQCDPTTFQCERFMYWPSCCHGAEYVFQCGDKPFLSADGVLSMYQDWRDIKEWAEIPGIEKRIERNLKRQQDPTEKNGIIGAFCRVYDVPTVIGKYLPDIYEPCEGGRYTYAAGSTSAGAVLYENGKFLYSNHATDPASGKLLNAFDLVRVHKFVYLDEEAKPDTPSTKLPSYSSMREFAFDDPLVKKEYLKNTFPESGGSGTGWLDALELDGRTEKPYFYKSQVEKVKAAHRLLTEDLERHYTIAELSARFSIPATALKECFKSVYGQPVNTYMRNLRMDRAALLLRQEPQTSVAEIAGRVGYDSASKFAAVFREAKGKTPLEYRREGR